MTIHMAKVVQTPAELETELDNAINRGWGLVVIVPQIFDGNTKGYLAVFSKGSNDD